MHSQYSVYGFLRWFTNESDTPQLVALLKFATSHSMVTSLTDINIKLELLDPEKVLLEAQARFSKLFLLMKATTNSKYLSIRV